MKREWKKRKQKKKEILEKALNSLCKQSSSQGKMNNESNKEDINDKKIV